MRARQFKHLMALTAKLTPGQREQLMARLGSGVALDQTTSVVQAHLSQHLGCPRCQAERVVRNGQANGLQRYKCRGCGVTFNALTGTPLARLRHRDKWLLQAQALDEGLSVRKAAARMGVHRTTAFRWRHRFLTLPREVKAQHLDGVAEADETYVLRSYKGQRRQLLAEQARKPRRRAVGPPNVAYPPSKRRRSAMHRRQQPAGHRGAGAGNRAQRGEHLAWRAHTRRLAHPERQCLPQPFQSLDGALQGSGDVLLAELPGLVQGARPEFPIRRQRRVIAGSGHLSMTSSSVNSN